MRPSKTPNLRRFVYPAVIAMAVTCVLTWRPAYFAAAAARPCLRSVWGDLDGDGRPDEVFIGHRGDTSSIEVLESGPRGGQTLSTDSATSSVIVVDIDGDGDLDVITASPAGSELWLNDGHGVFTPTRVPSQRSVSAPAAIDSAVLASLVAVTASPLGTEPVLSAHQRISSVRKPSHRPWFSSPVRSSHLLRAPPAISTLI